MLPLETEPNVKIRSEVKGKQPCSNPQMLVLLLLAAMGFSTILQFVVPYVMIWLISWTPGAAIFLSLLMQFVAFPFWIPCVVWLAARSGRTDWSTWIVPLVLIIAPNLMVFFGVFAMATFLPNVGYMSVRDMIHFQWMSFRSSLLTYVLLAILFRATTLHLRPVEVAALPYRLTILSILLLTSAVAIALSIDVFVNQRVSMQTNTMYPQSNYLSNFLFDFSNQLSRALVWFSVAWLFVARNSKRWIGIVGLIVYVMLLGVNMLVIAPLITNQGPFPPGVTMPVFGPSYFVGLFAISLFHILVVFLCVGMMHVAGYRWDIRRRLHENDVDFETRMDGMPPMLGTRIEINPQPPELAGL